VESVAEIPGQREGQGKTEGAKPALPRARPGRKEQEAVDEAARVISLDVFLMVSATGPGAIRGSSTARDHPGNASVRSRAGVRWSGWWSGNGDGGSRRPA